MISVEKKLEFIGIIKIKAETSADIEHIKDQIEIDHTLGGESVEIVESNLIAAAPKLLKALLEMKISKNQLRSEFLDLCESDPDFNYTPDEFDRWLADFDLLESEA
jgi:hypothetical protein